LTIPGGRSGRSRRLALTLGLIATFALVVIVAGHGAAPLGYLLVWGWDAWTAPDLLAWVAIVLLARGGLSAPGRPVGRGLLRLGGLASVASWVLFVRRSELLPLTLASSLPYLACLAAGAWQLRPGASDRASPVRAASSGAKEPAG
jgi:hypothetical protein